MSTTVNWLHAADVTLGTATQGEAMPDGERVLSPCAVVLSTDEVYVIQGERIALARMLLRAARALEELPAAHEHVRGQVALPLPTQADTQRTDEPGLAGQIAAAEQGEWQR